METDRVIVAIEAPKACPATGFLVENKITALASTRPEGTGNARTRPELQLLQNEPSDAPFSSLTTVTYFTGFYGLKTDSICVCIILMATL